MPRSAATSAIWWRWRRTTRAQSFAERHDQEKAREKMLRELQDALRLKRYPQRIECFDISMIHGAHAVGSMVDVYQRRAGQESITAIFASRPSMRPPAATTSA